ncbi:hypothetical protein BJ742DRAFT_858268 [Cladochytrium replicatum]|nr:hypothetical protein BJ742DRAFT_858268 [Cladochytrium replicatum]
MLRVKQIQSHLEGRDASSSSPEREMPPESNQSFAPRQIAPRRYVDIPEVAQPKLRVAVLCSWTGGNVKYLRRYGELYREQGHLPFYIESEGGPVFDTNPQSNANVEFWDPIVDYIVKLGIDCFGENATSDLVLHCFSNGGVMQIWKLYLALPRYEEKHGRLNLSGIIFDCGPGEKSVQSGISFTRALVTAGSKPGTASYAIRAYASYALFFLVLYPAIALRVPILSGDFYELNDEAMYSERLRPIPRLFMYSKTDRQIEYKAVENHIKRSRECGARTVRVCVWDKAEHVKLQMTHPAKYLDAVTSFLAGIKV